MGPQEQHEWLTAAEVAAEFRVSEKTVRRWASAGRLRGILQSDRVGWRFRRPDVDRFLSGLAYRLPPPTPAKPRSAAPKPTTTATAPVRSVRRRPTR